MSFYGGYLSTFFSQTTIFFSYLFNKKQNRYIIDSDESYETGVQGVPSYQYKDYFPLRTKQRTTNKKTLSESRFL